MYPFVSGDVCRRCSATGVRRGRKDRRAWRHNEFINTMYYESGDQCRECQ